MLRAHPGVDPKDQLLDDELESVLPLRLSPFGIPQAELVCLPTIERHLRRRSQRPFRPAEGQTFYAKLQRLGLRPLTVSR